MGKVTSEHALVIIYWTLGVLAMSVVVFVIGCIFVIDTIYYGYFKVKARDNENSICYQYSINLVG